MMSIDGKVLIVSMYYIPTIRTFKDMASADVTRETIPRPLGVCLELWWAMKLRIIQLQLAIFDTQKVGKSEMYSNDQDKQKLEYENNVTNLKASFRR